MFPRSAVCYFPPQTRIVVLTEIAFLPHYQMLNQCTDRGGEGGGGVDGGAPFTPLDLKSSVLTELRGYIDRAGEGVVSENLLPALWGIIGIHDLFSVC